MTASAGGRERRGFWLARRITAIAALMVVAVFAAIAADHYLAISQGLPSRWLRRLGKGTGEVAGILALISAGYYLGRELYAIALKRAIVEPANAGPLQAALRLLRLTHPLVGAATVAAAALHGYLLWSGRLRGDELTGLGGLAGLALLAGTGWLLAGGNHGAGLRAGHRFAALAFVVLFALHQLAAG